jgi:hypothetical protein
MAHRIMEHRIVLMILCAKILCPFPLAMADASL